MIIISSDPHGQAESLAAEARAEGREALLLPDLYHVTDDDPVWEMVRAVAGPATVVGPRYPRATEWLLWAHGVETEGWDFVQDERLSGSVTPPTERWYPVVDFSRCSNCHHCLQFCLFGVYEEDTEGHVCVTQPDSCKAGCPACSRVCPQGAIMFPLYEGDAAIAGAPGQTVQRDAAARRMFYARTEQTCPVCQADEATLAEVMEDGCCPECGRELKQADSAVLKEIDDLIDRLDKLADRE